MTIAPALRIALVHNPGAGRHSRRELDRIKSALTGNGATVHVAPTRADSSGGYTFDLPDGELDAIWVMGGDGAMRIVVAALLKAGRLEIPVGVIPLGTANVMAREFGTATQGLAPLLEATRAGNTRRLDIGAIDGCAFLMSAGFGFDGDAVARVNLVWKCRVRKIAYIAAAVSAGLHIGRAPRWRVLNGPLAGRDAGWILVANSARYAGGWIISDGTFSDGALEIFFFDARSPFDLAFDLAKGALGGRWPVAGRLKRGETLRIEGDGAIQVDGDPWRPAGRVVELKLLEETIPVLVAAF